MVDGYKMKVEIKHQEKSILGGGVKSLVGAGKANKAAADDKSPLVSKAGRLFKGSMYADREVAAKRQAQLVRKKAVEPVVSFVDDSVKSGKSRGGGDIFSRLGPKQGPKGDIMSRLGKPVKNTTFTVSL